MTKTPQRAFNMQKATAKRRGIAWFLSFDEWRSIWGGRLGRRGRRRDELCMARIGDAGPYAVGNVKIVTNAENLAERRDWSDGKRREFGAIRSRQLADGAYRRKLSDANNRLWSDPSHRAKMCAANKAAWDRRRAGATQ